MQLAPGRPWPEIIEDDERAVGAFVARATRGIRTRPLRRRVGEEAKEMIELTLDRALEIVEAAVPPERGAQDEVSSWVQDEQATVERLTLQAKLFAAMGRTELALKRIAQAHTTLDLWRTRLLEAQGPPGQPCTCRARATGLRLREPTEEQIAQMQV